jgi:hypothetical protein
MTGNSRPNAGNLRFAGVHFFGPVLGLIEMTLAPFQLEIPGSEGLPVRVNRLQQNRPDE